MTYSVLLISCDGFLDGSRAVVEANGDIDAIYKANEAWDTNVLWPTEIYAVWPDGAGTDRIRFYAVDENRLLHSAHEIA